nr:putative DNA packaging enzyme [Cedratvirus lena]
MQPREVLKMSLLFPHLFTEGMWRSLTPKWDHYVFLPYSNRKRYAEIAYRTCCMTGYYVRRSASYSRITSMSNYYSLKQQALFAVHNQRKDILQRLVSENVSEMHNLYQESLEEDKMHFNRSMFNYLASLLDIELTEREKFIASPVMRRESSEEQISDYMQVSVLNNPKSVYSRWFDSVSVEPGEDLKLRFIKDLCAHGDIAFWFMVYSRSQEKDILEKFIEISKVEDLQQTQAITILRGLFCGNHVQLASRFGTKFSLGMHVSVILSCLTTYYFNTGDDRGLYESLSYMQERGVFTPGPCVSDIFSVELPEVTSLLSKNSITDGTGLIQTITSLFFS